MTPADIANRYQQLRQRIDMHLPGACGEVSVPLPRDFADELAFYRLINWAYILLNEAGRHPIDFLIRLPPLQFNSSLRTAISRMRTFVAHNLDVKSPSDLKTRSFAQHWFRNACGVGTPVTDAHFAKCCSHLADQLETVLKGAVAACDLLDEPDDGPTLVSDLRGRIELQWDAHKFDPLVLQAAASLGNCGLDLIAIRRRNLEQWRATLAAADENNRETALQLRIEATLLAEIADTLPLSASEVPRQLAISGPQAVCAALLILQEVRRTSSKTVAEILEEIGRSVTT